MSQPLRNRVLRAYADLIRAQRSAFNKDINIRTGAMQKIRNEYKQLHINVTVSDPAKIEDLLKYSAAVSDYLRTNVVQAEQKGTNNYELKITNHQNKKSIEPVVAKAPPKPKDQ